MPEIDMEERYARRRKLYDELSRRTKDWPRYRRVLLGETPTFESYGTGYVLDDPRYTAEQAAALENEKAALLEAVAEVNRDPRIVGTGRDASKWRRLWGARRRDASPLNAAIRVNRQLRREGVFLGKFETTVKAKNSDVEREESLHLHLRVTNGSFFQKRRSSTPGRTYTFANLPLAMMYLLGRQLVGDPEPHHVEALRLLTRWGSPRTWTQLRKAARLGGMKLSRRRDEDGQWVPVLTGQPKEE